MAVMKALAPKVAMAPLASMAPLAPIVAGVLLLAAGGAVLAQSGGGVAKDGAAAPSAAVGVVAAAPGSAAAGSVAAGSVAAGGTGGATSGATGSAAAAAGAVGMANAAVAPEGVAKAPASQLDPEALARTYRATGVAPTVELADQGRGTVSLVPFGHGKPVLRCAPLRACAVELEGGELILATSLGDAERWLVQTATSGPGARTPLLVVKPTACDLTTNLLIATDRRLYELALDSPPCRNLDTAGGKGGYNPRLPYTGVVRFYYPDDLVRRWTDQESQARSEESARAAGRTPLAGAARLAQLNFAYTWDRHRSWVWVPLQVFDDGEHTYIVLPPAARQAELPILLAVEPGGSLALVNYHVEAQTLVADRVLERAVLLVGHGSPRDQQRLEITNQQRAGKGR